MPTLLSGKNIAILGAGITGLTAAFYLLREGARVTIFEAQPKAGGLASTFDFGDFHWDRFYHCILTSDSALLELIGDLGLSAELRWQATKVGFFAGGRLHSVSTTAEFLRFPVLNLLDKFRLGLGILYVCSIRDPRPLEAKLVSPWLIRVFGKRNYRRFWGPLLQCKLGACRDEASAAFMWATITRLYSTRDKSPDKQERLGYVRGGYRTVFNGLERAVLSLGGEIHTGAPVEKISSVAGELHVRARGAELAFDQIISTLPSKLLAQAAPQLAPEYLQKLHAVKYLGIVCFVLVLRRRLSPYYVTNLCDEGFPFTGIIEMTNLISAEETAGHHLVYLPKYTAPDDPLFAAGEDRLWTIFREGLLRAVPDLADADIERRFLLRERFVQPLPVLHYSDRLAPMTTSIPGLVQANTTQIINSTLNNNAMVQIARRAVELVSRGEPTASTPLDSAVSVEA